MRAFTGPDTDTSTVVSSWSPETAFLVLAAPAAPQQLRATWPHPQALRPELCWNEPTDQGGGGQDAVKIEKYLIWMHLMDGQVKLLDEVRDRLCFEVNLPEIFSSTFRFSVTAMNQVYEGLRSNILELATSGPPGTPGPIQSENITNDLILVFGIFLKAIFYGFYHGTMERFHHRELGNLWLWIFSKRRSKTKDIIELDTTYYTTCAVVSKLEFSCFKQNGYLVHFKKLWRISLKTQSPQRKKKHL